MAGHIPNAHPVVQSLTADLASSLGRESARGALVNSVAGDGPADAGLERGHLVLALDARLVVDSNDLHSRIAGKNPAATCV